MNKNKKIDKCKNCKVDQKSPYPMCINCKIYIDEIYKEISKDTTKIYTDFRLGGDYEEETPEGFSG